MIFQEVLSVRFNRSLYIAFERCLASYRTDFSFFLTHAQKTVLLTCIIRCHVMAIRQSSAALSIMNSWRTKFFLRATNYIYRQSTYYSVCPTVGIGDSPTSSLASECAPPPGTKGGGGHTRLRVKGWESPNSDDCLLCA
jgi:hypothetical protein